MTVNWNQFPLAPLMELALHMGAQFPPKLKLSGSMDGAIGYSGQGSFQGELAFHDTAVTIPDSPPVRFDQAHMVLDHGHDWSPLDLSSTSHSPAHSGDQRAMS